MLNKSEVNTNIIRPGADKFTPPVPPLFSLRDSVFSALSLLVFAIASVGGIILAHGWPPWAIAPFWFTAFGSVVGFLYESWLIANGRPYQLFGTKKGLFIQAIRGGNLAFVFGSTYLAYALLTFGNSANIDWLIVIIGVITGFLLAIFLFKGPPELAFSVVIVSLFGQLLLLALSSVFSGNHVAQFILVLAAVGLFSTSLIGADTPKQSTAFHSLAVVVVLLLFFGFRTTLRANPSPVSPDTTVIRWILMSASVIAGVFLAFRITPITWGVLRSLLVNATWPLFYLIIAGGMRFPRPARLSTIYKDDAKLFKPLTVYPYYIAHSRAQTHAISVPSLDEALTLKVQSFGFLLKLVRFIFGLASVFSRAFPFANINIPLSHKPRMDRWSDGSDYWPYWLFQTIYIPTLGKFVIESGVQGPGLQPTPAKALETYQDGQLLAFLVEYGIANSFLEAETVDGHTRFKMDLSFLETYESKDDYEPYGGAAYFVIDDTNKSLKLVSVRPPRSNLELRVDPTDASFRHAEDLVLASLYFYVVSCKHLVEIHMGLNLIEVALVNSFDVKQQWRHPVRLALYPHLFAHELAEELTTENLLEDRAVFSQIFATTNSALMLHLNDRFSEYQLARDEDFEERERVILTGRNPEENLADVLPRSSLVWEKDYAAIWQRYADSLVDAVYPTDGDVSSDECIQTLFADLTRLYHQPLPSRYYLLQTKKGLSRFISDTLHHLIIRHEVYGTTGVRLALDPRINKVQVPKDGGAYPIDEWRSLACIAMATSRVRYTKLMPDFSDTFDDVSDQHVRIMFHQAHDQLQASLMELEVRYTTDGVDNYNTLRLLPSLLDIGAGY